MGVPTPNLFTGMQNIHGPQEWVSVQDMARATEMCIELAQLWSSPTRAAAVARDVGKLSVETTDFQLDEVISSVTTVTAQKAHDKGLEFLADVPTAIPDNLRGDPLRLGQILTNFVINSLVHAFDPGQSGQIHIEVTRTNGAIEFNYGDNGNDWC
jgi:signal transduction histidine kinase